MSMVSIERIADLTSFLASWSAFYERSEVRPFFLSSQWMSALIENAPPGSAFYLITAGENDDPQMMGVLGVADRTPPLIGLKEARLYESGNAALDAIYVEDTDFLHTADAPSSLRAEILKAVKEQFADLDSIILRNARRPLADAAQNWAVSSDWRAVILREQPVFAVNLEAARRTGGEFIDTLSSSLRSKIRRAMRGYEERGPLTCKVVQSDQEQSEAWQAMASLHQATWRDKGEAGAFANERFNKFHRSLQAKALEAYQLFEVFSGKDRIGVLYNFIHEGRVLNYQGGFVQETDNKLTPGFVCHALACQHYMNAGYKEYDFLAGAAEYKERFGEQTQMLSSIALERPSWRNKLRQLIKGHDRRAVLRKASNMMTLQSS